MPNNSNFTLRKLIFKSKLQMVLPLTESEGSDNNVTLFTKPHLKSNNILIPLNSAIINIESIHTYSYRMKLS